MFLYFGKANLKICEKVLKPVAFFCAILAQKKTLQQNLLVLRQQVLNFDNKGNQRLIFVAQATQFKHIKASMFVSILGSLFGIDVTDKALAC